MMSETISVSVAKTQLSRLIARAEAGEEIVIARRRKPVAKLVPIVSKAKRVFGALRGKLSVGPEFFEPLPPKELGSWEQTPPDLQCGGREIRLLFRPPAQEAVRKSTVALGGVVHPSTRPLRGLLRTCEGIVELNTTSLIPSFLRKQESRDFSRLPPVQARGRLWTPAFAGVTN